MIKSAVVRPSWGIALGVNLNGANFTFFDVGLHYHVKPIEGAVLSSEEFCDFRAGVYLTVFGFGVRIGRFWNLVDEKDEKVIDY